jgi:hypothetical protein
LQGGPSHFPIVSPKDFPNARQPQAAVAGDGTIHVVFGNENAIYSTRSRNGDVFSVPVKVGEVGALALGVRRGPRIAAGKNLVVTAIGGDIGGGKDGDVLAWHSADSGATWQGPVRVNSVRASAREGLHHLTASPDGTVYCVWLDLRNKRMEVFGAASTDGGVTWVHEQCVYAAPDGSVCECCQPAAAFDPKGGLHVMWRNQIAGRRDMYIAHSNDGGKTFGPAALLGTGAWQLNACPMDGGALAADGSGRVETIWRRDRTVYRCAPGTPEEALGTGEQGWVAAGPGGFYHTWLESRPGTIKVRRPGTHQPITLATHASDPVLASSPTGGQPVVLVWEEGKPGAMRLRAAVLAKR